MVENSPESGSTDVVSTKIRKAKRYDFTRWRTRKACDKVCGFNEDNNWFGTRGGALSEHTLGPLSVAGAFVEQAYYEDEAEESEK